MKKEYNRPPTREDFTRNPEYEKLEEEIVSFWKCNHENITCVVTMTDGRESIKDVCKLCGHAGGSQSRKKFTQKEQSKMHRTTTSGLIDYRQKHHEKLERLINQQKSIKEDIITNHSESWWEWYKEYLLSPEWKDKRQLVMGRARNVCESCGSNAAKQVHHIAYDHVGNEPLWELKAVCDECHEVLHSEKVTYD